MDTEEILHRAYPLLADRISDVFIILDSKGNVIFVNRRIYEWLGYKPEEIIGRNIFFMRFMPLASVKLATRNLIARFKGVDVSPYKLEFVSKSGNHVYGMVKGYLIKDEAGKVLADLVIVSDVTDENQMLEAYSRERERLWQVLDLLNMIVVLLDLDGRIVFLNRRGCDILEFTKDEVTGKNWFDNFLPPDEKDNIRSVFDKILKSGLEENEFFENRVRTKSGNERLIYWHNSYFRDDRGKISGILSIGEDVTEIREREDELRKKTEELERLNKLMVGRELRMIELKNKLKEKNSL